MTPEQAKAVTKAGEHLGFNLVVYLPVLTSVFAFSYGIYRIAIWLELGDGAGSLPNWLAVVWFVIVLLIFAFNKFFRGWFGWLFSLAFLAWFLTSPPSAAVAAARERQELLKQHEQTMNALQELRESISECITLEDAAASAGKVRDDIANVCAQRRADLDSRLSVIPTEVLRNFCDSRDERAKEREAIGKWVFDEPRALVAACESSAVP